MSRFLQQRNNRIFIGEDGRIVVPYLETYLSYGCNLRCSFCGNMSPLSCGIESKETLLQSIEAWGQRFRPGCFALGGGEPLLHPDFMEIVAAACRSFPDSVIAVLTNGTLLTNFSDADLRQFAELQRVDFRISEKQNGDSSTVRQSAERLRSHAISHTVKTTHFKKLYEVDHIGSPIPSNSNPAAAWANCYANDCRNIIGDTLTYCSRLALIRRSLANDELDKRWYRANGHTPMTLANSQQEIVEYLHKGWYPECSLCPERLDDVQARQMSESDVAHIKRQTITFAALNPVPTIDNTLFVSVGAYPNPEERCRNFINSAAKFRVPVTWLSWGEKWYGFNTHKLRLFREKCNVWRSEGKEYVFMLDSKDVVFADTVEVILRKASEVYEPGTLLFNAEFDHHIYPYSDVHFKAMVMREGCHVNSGMIFGHIETFMTVIDLALDIIDGIKNGIPRAGIAEYIANDLTTKGMMEDDQFTYQIASVYYPQYFRLDTDRYLLAWTRVVDKPLSEMRREKVASGGVGQASLIHSSSTISWAGQHTWDRWVRESQLVD